MKKTFLFLFKIEHEQFCHSMHLKDMEKAHWEWNDSNKAIFSLLRCYEYKYIYGCMQSHTHTETCIHTGMPNFSYEKVKEIVNLTGTGRTTQYTYAYVCTFSTNTVSKHYSPIWYTQTLLYRTPVGIGWSEMSTHAHTQTNITEKLNSLTKSAVLAIIETANSD